MRRLAAPGLFVVLAFAFSATSSAPEHAAPAAAPGQSWPAYGHDPQLTNFVRLAGLTHATAHRLGQVWTKKLDGPVVASPPLVLGDVVFAAGGETGGYAALAARTGKLLWRLPTRAATFAPVIAAEGRIFAGDYGGTLHVFAPRGRRAPVRAGAWR